MDSDQFWRWLDESRALQGAHRSVDDLHIDRALARFDAFADLSATNGLAGQLAETTRSTAADLLVVGDGASNAALGFVIGLALGLPVLRLADDEGLVAGSASVPHNAKAAVVMVTEDERFARMAIGYLRLVSASTSMILAAVASRAWPHEAIVRLEDRAVEAQSCTSCREGQPLSQPTSTLRE